MLRRVCLIEPPHQGEYSFEYIPLGLLSIAGALQREGHEVSVHLGMDVPSCDVLCISASTLQYRDAVRIAKDSFASMTIIGGAHATTDVADTMRSCAFDYAAIGDGDDIVPMLIRGYTVDPANIAGLAYRRRGVIMASPNLDTDYRFRDDDGIPRGSDERVAIPAYELLAGGLGRHVGISRNREYSWRRKWCRQNRTRLGRDFAVEVTRLRDLGVEEVTVVDEDFGSWSKSIGSTVVALDTVDRWHCRTQTKTVLRRRLDQTLRGSRCETVELFIGTASERLLAEHGMRSIEDHELAIELLSGIGIGVVCLLTPGLPGETVDSMEETRRWASGRRARIERVLPLPGNKFYEQHTKFAAFGYEIVEQDFNLYEEGLPWVMDTIGHGAFLDLESALCEEVV